MRTFTQWLERHHYATKKSPVVTPQAEKVWVLIRDSGPTGIKYGQLAANIDLERETLDDVIHALVSFGRVKVSWDRGQRIYRAG
jgi:hypothetical protein